MYKVNKDEFELSLLVFYVTGNDISVMCDGTDVQAD